MSNNLSAKRPGYARKVYYVADGASKLSDSLASGRNNSFNYIKQNFESKDRGRLHRGAGMVFGTIGVLGTVAIGFPMFAFSKVANMLRA
jgi:hypothetical protein